MKLSKYNRALLYAVKRGACVLRDGTLIGLRRTVVKGTVDSVGYLCLGVKFEGNTVKIAVHKIQAYQKFGDKLFAAGIEVRHLNGNGRDNSWKNISIGTSHANKMDIPKSRRVAAAKKAAATQRKFSDAEIDMIRKCRSKGMTYVQLMEKFNIRSKGHVSDIINRRVYK